MILGICGSPRKQATEYVLKKALEIVERSHEVKFFTVRGKTINPCRHCDYCIKNKKCIIEDDMKFIYETLPKASGIIMATPVYNGGVSAQLKAIMDRCRALGAQNFNFLENKSWHGDCSGRR